MKSFLLSFVIVFTALLTRGQQVLIKDSTVRAVIDTTSFRIASTNTYTYDENCRLIKVIRFTQPLLATSYKEYFSYEYNPDGKLYRLSHSIQNSDPFTFGSSERFTYTYTSIGLLETTLREIAGSPDMWRAISISTRTYNEKGQLTDSVLHYYAADSSVKTNLIYNDDGYLIRSLMSSLSHGSDVWTIDTSFLYFPDISGRNDSVIVTSGSTGLLARKIYFNFGLPNAVTETRLNYNSTGQLSSKFRIYTDYDSSGYKREDTTVQTMTTVQEPDVFALESARYMTTYYNYDGHLKQQNQVLAGPSGKKAFYLKVYYTWENCSTVLPVGLLSFTGKSQTGVNNLYWQTANETNTASFAVQRSTDGVNFTTIDRVPARGNNSQTNYSYSDIKSFLLPATKLYYRLAETNRNGTVTYSNTIPLDVVTGNMIVSLSPNPVTSTITISALATLNQARITVRDMSGRIVYAAVQNIIAGSKTIIDVSRMTKGVYIVSIQSATIKQQLKIVKE